VKNPPTFQEEAHCWTRRYEQLREQVLAGDSLIATDCRGLALVIRQGMVAWAFEKDGLSLNPPVDVAPSI
jgi:hypothetical protein